MISPAALSLYTALKTQREAFKGLKLAIHLPSLPHDLFLTCSFKVTVKLLTKQLYIHHKVNAPTTDEVDRADLYGVPADSNVHVVMRRIEQLEHFLLGLS